MRVLDLTDNMLLICSADALYLVDRQRGLAGEADAFLNAWIPPELIGGPVAVTAVFQAARRSSTGDIIATDRIVWEESHEIYAGKVLEGVAYYVDGVSEYWRLRVDPNLMRFQWNRQPERATEQPLLRAFVPRRRDVLQFWRTGDGEQLINEAVPHAEGFAPALTLRDESELLFYASAARNVLRLEMPTGIALRIEAGTAPDFVSPEGALAWTVYWEAAPTAVLQTTITCGLTNAVRHFDGAQRIFPANAGLDFDSFYARVYLGCLPLNLHRGARGLLCANAMAFQPVGAGNLRASLREVTWACECAALLDPVIVAALARDTLIPWQQAMLDAGREDAAHPLAGEDAALLLLLAGRHHVLTGDLDFAGEMLYALRQCALYLLAHRPPRSFMPAITTSWGYTGAPMIEPYFTALCHTGLARLAVLEETLGYPQVAEWWTRAAHAMRVAACQSFEDGGLRDPERGTFIRGQLPDGAPGAKSQPQTDFLLYQNVVAFRLGLLDDPEHVQQAYDWIDDRYTYASGRGGVALPPGIDRTFIVLLDVGVRHQYAVPGAERLLAFALSHALDAGLPFTDTPFGAYGGSGPTELPGDPPRVAQTCAGSLLDNSPYFDLVLRQHYGLDYDHQGWHIGTPKPLPGYPLTRVTHLRHRHALYAVTWQGRGQVRRILVDGTPFQGSVLTLSEGDHEVVVQLR
jgi:hypothetical protein